VIATAQLVYHEGHFSGARPRLDPHTPPPSAEAPLEGTEVLLARVRAGDQSALNTLIARYLAPLRRWARGRLPRWARDMRDTDDLVQETLVATLNHLDDFEVRKEGALHAYLRQSITNRIRDEVRRVGRRPSAEPADERIEARAPSPLEEVIGAEALARYEKALNNLSAIEREAVIARVELGLSYIEIAAAIGKSSADAARMTTSRALLKLAEEMSRA
jgi:RNA polymerase sigma factor (sigma-70 family)